MRPHDPETYRTFRPSYPGNLYRSFWTQISRIFPKEEELLIADIGSGLGHSTRSLIGSAPEAFSGKLLKVIGIEPDPRMFAAAQKEPNGDNRVAIQFLAGSAEQIPLPNNSSHAITFGSSYHWAAPNATNREILRVLRPGGLIHLYETQFPKTSQCHELNEWLRRGFNTTWRLADQKPRGSLWELTRKLRENSSFRVITQEHPPMQLPLGWADLSGLLFSQSRFVDWISRQAPELRNTHQVEIECEIRRFYEQVGANTFDFDFALTSILMNRI